MEERYLLQEDIARREKVSRILRALPESLAEEACKEADEELLSNHFCRIHFIKYWDIKKSDVLKAREIVLQERRFQKMLYNPSSLITSPFSPMAA